MINPFDTIIKILDDHKIEYKILKHKPVYTSDEAAVITGIPINQGAKSLVLKADENFILTVMPGDCRLDMKSLKEKLNVKKIRFALPQEVKEIMGCEIGACYPFGNIINLKTIADEMLASKEKIAFNPGVHDQTIIIQWKDYEKIVKPIISKIIIN